MEILFIFIIAVISFCMIFFGSVNLTKEKWQMMAAVPITKNKDNTWKSRPITYYGFFSAFSYTFATTLYLVLANSVFNSYKMTIAAGLPILAICIPASKLIALIVEKRKNTFTIGGASFLGFITAPLWLYILKNHLISNDFSITAALSSIIIAYCFGEGLGRLACISFGCCYGKPVKDLPEKFQFLFYRFNYKFTGHTKKAAYDGDLENTPLIPVQGITSFLYSLTGVISLILFFKGKMISSFIFTLTITQFWRFFSEFLRNDFRGDHKKISVYQIMALTTIPYGVCAAYFSQSFVIYPDIKSGLSLLWNPGFLIFLEVLFIYTFLYTGRSKVTEAHLKFNVSCHGTTNIIS